MDILISFVVGAVFGWIVNRLFWRQPSQSSQVEASLARDLDAARAEKQELSARLEEALNRKPEVIVKEVKVSTAPDRLQDIKGIGNVFAGRLNEAGIRTFADLAATSPEKIEQIIKPAPWQEFNYREWADAARELAARQRPQA